MKDFTIELPLPPKGVSPNRAGHEHYSKRSKATQEYRKAAWALMREALPKDWKPVPVRISHAWYMGQSAAETKLRASYLACGGKKRLSSEFYRPRDKQNAIAALKAVVDGFVDAKLVPDDSAQWVDWGPCTFYSKPDQHGGRSCVVVTVEVVE
jgi:Holliday junction resolvase RusA-like endonuclease